MTRRDWIIAVATFTMLLLVGVVTDRWPQTERPINFVVAVIAVVLLVFLVVQAVRRPPNELK